MQQIFSVKRIFKMATCDAGHGCSISCSNGCGAIYNHGTGQCSKWCEASATKLDPKELDGTFSIEVNDMSVSVLASILGEKLLGDRYATLAGADKRVSFKLESTDLGKMLTSLS
jgi:hypothetical protein